VASGRRRLPSRPRRSSTSSRAPSRLRPRSSGRGRLLVAVAVARGNTHGSAASSRSPCLRQRRQGTCRQAIPRSYAPARTSSVAQASQIAHFTCAPSGPDCFSDSSLCPLFSDTYAVQEICGKGAALRLRSRRGRSLPGWRLVAAWEVGYHHGLMVGWAVPWNL
jgi:hypothetical protein